MYELGFSEKEQNLLKYHAIGVTGYSSRVFQREADCFCDLPWVQMLHSAFSLN